MSAQIRLAELSLPCKIAETPEAFLRELGQTSLLRVRGRDPSRCRVVSTLLHGNEPSGLRAIHAWLRRGELPAVDALLFIGAVQTALEPPGFAHRFLPGRADLNRCFLPPYTGLEGETAHEALTRFRAASPEALVDIHNNTGHNPPYGVGPRAETAQLNLVSCFGDRYVHSDLRLGALVEATQDDFPSVTVECGRAGDPVADAVALTGIERFLHREHLATESLELARMQLLVDPVRVGITHGIRLAFGERPEPGAHLTVVDDVDRHNFEELTPGVRIGWLGAPDAWPLAALDARGVDRSRELFVARGDVLETRCEIIPIMMTTNPSVAASDCLFYVVRRGPQVGPGAPGRTGAD